VAVTLFTQRLTLRPFREEDLADLLAMDGDDRVMRWIGPGLPGRTRDEARQSLERMIAFAREHPGLGLRHASRLAAGGFVGGCGLYPLTGSADVEIAYRLPHACWGHGYATEMAAAVLEHGFRDLRLVRIVGLTHPGNVSSQRVLEKIGMRAEGTAAHYGREMRVFAAHRAGA